MYNMYSMYIHIHIHIHIHTYIYIYKHVKVSVCVCVCVCAHSRGDSPQGTSIHMDFCVMHVSERASMSGKKHQCCFCIYMYLSIIDVTSSDCCMTYMFRKQACNPSNTMAQFPHCGCGYGIRIVCHVYMLSC